MNRVYALYHTVLPLLLGLCLLLPTGTSAQPTLNFKKIVSNWPTIALHFSVRCNGKRITTADKSLFTVYENGEKIGDFELWCPDSLLSCPVSVALVFDGSGSMGNGGVAIVKEAGKVFVDLMDGVKDEAAVIWFANGVTLHQGMTTSKSALRAAIDAGQSSGGTALWDGVYMGITEVMNKASNPCRAVIVLTDGQDNRSSHTLDQTIAYAKAAKIPVYTIGFGANATSGLKRLATETGGTYIDVSRPEELIDVYESLIFAISGAQDCIITYKARCTGKGEPLRSVDLTALLCSGSDTKTRTYIAPYDSSMARAITMRLGSEKGIDGEDITIPLQLLSPLTDDLLFPSTITFQYDPACMEFRAFRFPVTSPLAGIKYTVDRSAGLVTVRTTEQRSITTTDLPALLAELVFRPYEPYGKDTTCCEVNIGSWLFTGGCLKVFATRGKICVPPVSKLPELTLLCTVPDSLHYESSAGTYAPNPFDVRLTCINRGRVPAYNTIATLYLPADVSLADPADSLRRHFPSPLAPWKTGNPIPSVSWPVKYGAVPKRDRFLDFRFVVTSVAENGVPIDTNETWCRVRVPGQAPDLLCEITLPDSLSVDASGADLTPNPFPITYRVWNSSRQMISIQNIALRYPTADGLRLDPNTPRVRVVNRVLAPGDSIVVDWLMFVDAQRTPRNLAISAVAIDSDNFPVECERMVRIPAVTTLLRCNTIATPSDVHVLPDGVRDTAAVWTISTELHNAGPLPVLDLSVAIRLADSTLAALQEFDPSFPDNSNPRMVPLIFPNGSAIVEWRFRATAAAADGLRHDIAYGISYSNKDVVVSDARCGVQVALAPRPPDVVLGCALTGPDTIYFDTDHYTPNPFAIGLTIHNSGSTTARSVRAMVLQDTRFNILSPALREYGDVRGGSTVAVDSLNNPPFFLHMNTRERDGYDTVRVLLVAEGQAPVICELPIFVLHERRPSFRMSCTANPERLVFNESIDDYVPNPFTVTSTVYQDGETDAEQCVLLFVGPPRFTPADDSPIVTVGINGRLASGDSVKHVWHITALPRSVGGWDTLVYQVQGRGGLGHRLIIGECRVPVYVPAARTALYGIDCASPDTLGLDPDGGRYVPDPFEITARIRNTGSATGRDLRVTALLPPGLLFAQGETAEHAAGDLDVDSVFVTRWLVRPAAHTEPGGRTLRVCFRVTDARRNSAECCDDTHVPPLRAATVALDCAAESSELRVNTTRAVYEPNPFRVTAVLHNNGERPVSRVSIRCIPSTHDVYLADSSERFLAARLEAHRSSDMISWQVVAQPRTSRGDVVFRFITTSDDAPAAECSTVVGIPALGAPDLHCAVSTSMTRTGDTLYFDRSIEDFRDDVGTRGYADRYNVCVIHADVSNSGAVSAQRMIATLLPPPGMSLDDGENAVRTLADIAPNGSARVSWKLRPLRQPMNVTGNVEVIVNAENAVQSRCARRVTIHGAPKAVRVRISRDITGRTGEKVSVPIFVDTTYGREITSYKLNVSFDPDAIRFIDAVSVNSATGRGWNGPRSTLWRDAGGTDPSRETIVRIEDNTFEAPLNLRREALLVRLVFEVVYTGGPTAIGAFVDSLRFVDIFTAGGSGGGRVLASSMNSHDDAAPAPDLRLITEDGFYIVSGDCLPALQLKTEPTLSQNSPNPYNPATTIRYTLPATTHVRLAVYDTFGRELSVLVDAEQVAGEHSAVFHAGSLPSGVYLYRLTTPSSSLSRSMLLAR
ncbi:MAG: VWA domain-containing protein [Ignavibacteriae bacterium]|nr:VWA domain-containing protein [Ignavibacteriota bacterium]